MMQKDYKTMIEPTIPKKKEVGTPIQPEWLINLILLVLLKIFINTLFTLILYIVIFEWFLLAIVYKLCGISFI